MAREISLFERLKAEAEACRYLETYSPAQVAAEFEQVRRGGKIRIFTGEANPAVWNQEHVVQALTDAKEEQGAEIHVLTGPIVIVDENGFNGLLHLRRLGFVDLLYARGRRESTPHYRVVETEDGLKLVTEHEHEPLFENTLVATASSTNGVWDRFAKGHAEAFDGNVHEVLLGFMTYRTNPLMGTAEVVAQLMKEADEHGLRFSYLPQENLLRLPSGSGLQKFSL